MQIITPYSGANFLPTPHVGDRLTFHIIYQPLQHIFLAGLGSALRRGLDNEKHSL